MDSWKIQTSKEIKEIHQLLETQFGFTGKLEYAFLLNSQNNLYIVSRDVANIDWKTLRIKSAGMYFAEWKTGIRLS
ncbi:hypothetical protein HY492_02775, partial [Candidatus Woesearchaeota archaeon]|nr:hypothetical protein [Candidatus Woesearchaeota archaeon]